MKNFLFWLAGTYLAGLLFFCLVEDADAVGRSCWTPNDPNTVERIGKLSERGKNFQKSILICASLHIFLSESSLVAKYTYNCYTKSNTFQRKRSFMVIAGPIYSAWDASLPLVIV